MRTAPLFAALLFAACAGPDPIVEALQVEFDAASGTDRAAFCQVMETRSGLVVLSEMADQGYGIVMGTFPMPDDPAERVRVGEALDRLADDNC